MRRARSGRFEIGHARGTFPGCTGSKARLRDGLQIHFTGVQIPSCAPLLSFIPRDMLAHLIFILSHGESSSREVLDHICSHALGFFALMP